MNQTWNLEREGDSNSKKWKMGQWIGYSIYGKTHQSKINFMTATKYLWNLFFSGPLLLIVEFCPYGNLRDFLRSNRPSLIDDKKAQLLTFRDLLSIAYQITRGMSYLSSKKVKYHNTYIHLLFSNTNPGVWKTCLQLQGNMSCKGFNLQLRRCN